MEQPQIPIFKNNAPKKSICTIQLSHPVSSIFHSAAWRHCLRCPSKSQYASWCTTLLGWSKGHVMPVLSSMLWRSSGKARMIASICVRNFSIVSGFTGKCSRPACNYIRNIWQHLHKPIFIYYILYINNLNSLTTRKL